uniref:Putative methyltransferase type 11 n=1 Tax=Magnetococcus massalia (strain MO-1) TaxID=451514 RepID=A0A1S7LKQ7_MAGMO|nr:Putative methyltransferase type 11 [Candidatus Magnetococcus massalia]
MQPADYDAWYATPMGRWVGQCELRMLLRQLAPCGEKSMIDVGCGTGYFTRHLAKEGASLVGLDIAQPSLQFARQQGGEIAYLQGDAASLPFADESFDHAVAITSLPFVAEPERAISEMTRVARERVVIGLLNGQSLHLRQHAGSRSYGEARWYTPAQARALVARAMGEQSPWQLSHLSTALSVISPYPLGRWLEPLLPGFLPWGAFLFLVLQKAR